MTVLLWILLILAAAVWVTAASPIRFGAAATFGKSKRASGKFWLSYIHPALFLYEYSSIGHKERVVIFGLGARWFRWLKWFGRKRRKRKDIDNDNGVNSDNISMNSETSKVNSYKNSINPETDGNNSDKISINSETDNVNSDNISINSEAKGVNSYKNSINSETDGNNSDNISINSETNNVNSDNIGINSQNINDDDDTLMTRVLRRVEHIKDDPIYTKTVDKLNDIKSGWSRGYLKDRVFRKKLFKWLRRALNCALTTVRFDKLELRAAAGLSNPADTGKVYGYFTAAKSALTTRHNKTVINIEVEPVFTEETLDADIEFACRTSMAVITSHALTMALTFPYPKSRKSSKSNSKS